MAVRSVPLRVTAGAFRGLARQNLLFHQALGELVDNSLAATPQGEPARIHVVLDEVAGNAQLELWVVDDGKGMSATTLEAALQLGESATTDSRLNEHGYGLKNSLATLTGAELPWTLWTRVRGTPQVSRVAGPFGPSMEIDDDSAMPDHPVIGPDASTVVVARVKLDFLQTVQGRGALAQNLTSLRQWLVEHLGVMYRGYLELDPTTNIPSAVIHVHASGNAVRVHPVPVPLGRTEEPKHFRITLGGHEHQLTYRHGALDTYKRDTLLQGTKPARYYYQGNQPTQGIDIRLGKRVIATMQLGSIWQTAEGQPMQRHNSLNDFVGELLIPEVPRGMLSTTNSKTDFNLADPDWQAIFAELRQSPPQRDVRDRTETGLRGKWMTMLKATNRQDTITDERGVWQTRTRIDVFRQKDGDGDVIIYELKVGTGEPIHLYQLKMYWDGLLREGKQPREALLLVQDYPATLQEMADEMNVMPAPPIGGIPSEQYRFVIQKHADVNL